MPRSNLLGAALLLVYFSAQAQTDTLVQWRSGTEGVVDGTSVMLSTNGPSMPTLLPAYQARPGTWRFPTGGEAVEIRGGLAGPVYYTVRFSRPVRGVMVHMASLASTLEFDRPVARLAGDPSFVVNGNQVMGREYNPPRPRPPSFSDSAGSVFLFGELQEFRITALPGRYGPSGEGIAIQLATNVIPGLIPGSVDSRDRVTPAPACSNQCPPLGTRGNHGRNPCVPCESTQGSPPPVTVPTTPPRAPTPPPGSSSGKPYVCYGNQELNFAGCKGRYTYLCNSGSDSVTAKLYYDTNSGNGKTTLTVTATAPPGAQVGQGAPELVGGSVFSWNGVCTPRGWTIALPGQ